MSETWHHALGSLQRLKAALRDADEDTRYRFAFWLSGLSLMALAIIAQFGWLGAVFCVGCVVRAAGEASGLQADR